MTEDDLDRNRRHFLTVATVATGLAGGALAAGSVAKMLKPMIAKIGTKVTTKAAAKGAGKAAAKVASKTGAKVGAKVGGKFLGAIVGVGIIVWDVWDHHQTRQVEEPILRRNLTDYLEELKQSLLFEPETGLMTMIESLEAAAVSSLKTLL